MPAFWGATTTMQNVTLRLVVNSCEMEQLENQKASLNEFLKFYSSNSTNKLKSNICTLSPEAVPSVV